MWTIAKVGRSWQVALFGIPLRTGFPTFESALAFTVSDDEAGLDATCRAQLAEG